MNKNKPVITNYLKNLTIIVTSILLLSIPVLVIGTIPILLITRNYYITFFNSVNSYKFKLYQHLFYFFNHFQIYIILVSSFSIISYLVIKNFAIKKLKNYCIKLSDLIRIILAIDPLTLEALTHTFDWMGVVVTPLFIVTYISSIFIFSYKKHKQEQDEKNNNQLKYEKDETDVESTPVQPEEKPILELDENDIAIINIKIEDIPVESLLFDVGKESAALDARFKEFFDAHDYLKELSFFPKIFKICFDFWEFHTFCMECWNEFGSPYGLRLVQLYLKFYYNVYVKLYAKLMYIKSKTYLPEFPLPDPSDPTPPEWVIGILLAMFSIMLILVIINYIIKNHGIQIIYFINSTWDNLLVSFSALSEISAPSEVINAVKNSLIYSEKIYKLIKLNLFDPELPEHRKIMENLVKNWEIFLEWENLKLYNNNIDGKSFNSELYNLNKQMENFHIHSIDLSKPMSSTKINELENIIKNCTHLQDHVTNQQQNMPQILDNIHVKNCMESCNEMIKFAKDFPQESSCNNTNKTFFNSKNS